MNPQTEQQLKLLEFLIKEGELTEGKHAGDETFVCIKQRTAFGTNYHQYTFGTMTPDMQKILQGQVKGFEFGGVYKLIAVYDIWAPEMKESVQSEFVA